MNLKIASLLLSSSLIGACTTLTPHQDLCYDPLIWPQGTCDRRDGDGPSVVTPVKPDPDDHGGDTDGDNPDDDGDDDVDTPDDTSGDHSDTSDDSNGDNSDDDNGHGNDDDHDDDSNPGKGKGKHK